MYAPSNAFRNGKAGFRLLERRIVEKPWGRRHPGKDFGDLGDGRIGEIWFLPPPDDTRSPLLKFLFTSERLSIQVHPDDKVARRTGAPCGKDECWLVVAGDDDARIGVGLNRNTDHEALRAAALDGSIMDMIDWRRAHVDDFIYNPAGTIHAIGAGLTIVEVQQNCDTTYRLYDYGRERPLHLDEALEVAHLSPTRDERDCSIDPNAASELVRGPYFHLHHLVAPFDPATVANAKGMMTLLPLAGDCRVAEVSILVGQAAQFDDPNLLDLRKGARALLAWAA
jgi:mannose-6-phosphate isomerase